MNFDGRGVGWRQVSLIAIELKCDQLVYAVGPDWKIDLQIRLFPGSISLLPAAEVFWQQAVSLSS
ncbi:MAG: hypothetical protein A3J24_09370 [Deltaproteobacteria bacterium RIFCSPLOWO2_02_FULL_53_8]|nr:MAG: hypothetical protein A3J24_09370 [Deltaproteobacteria bacterium RIFCSPLOWO2_02_FULL_53_8]